MLPSSIQCQECFQSYHFPASSAGLYLYAPDYSSDHHHIREEDLISIPLKPVWCSVCNKPTFAEDFRTIRDWEGAFALLKAGEPIEFPIQTSHLDDHDAMIKQFRILFRIREKRTDRGRCLSCGGVQYTEIGTPDTGLRHDGCNGYFVRTYSLITALYKISAYQIFSVDGSLIGHLGHGEEEGSVIVNKCTDQ